MKKIARLFFVSLFLITGCTEPPAPTKEEVKKVLLEYPEILYEVIEKHPMEFMEVLNKTATKAQAQMAKEEETRQEKDRSEEFLNPKKPEIAESRAVHGGKSAPVTIVEYSDFQCPYCSKSYETMKKLLKDYEGQIRLIYKHLPLNFHSQAMTAARYFEAIAMQSPENAYELHDLIFENQGDLASGGKEWLEKLADKMGVDREKMLKDLGSEEVTNIIESDMAEARKFGISGTPGFLINGVSLRGAYPIAEFRKIIDRHLKELKQE